MEEREEKKVIVPKIIGVLNLTEDSFYDGGAFLKDKDYKLQVEKIEREGASIIDLGACSTRPGATLVSPQEEKKRLFPVLEYIRHEHPGMEISLDSVYGSVVDDCHRLFSIDYVNDISAGRVDPAMFKVVGSHGLKYILMHGRGTPENMQQMTHYDNLKVDVIDFFKRKIEQLKVFGVKDIICDLGFGFAKTLEQNYELLRCLPEVKNEIGLPMLVGVSRKSMIYNCLGVTPEGALNGTTVLHTLSVMNGADYLRVHDVKEANEVKKLLQAYKK